MKGEKKKTGKRIIIKKERKKLYQTKRERQVREQVNKNDNNNKGIIK